MVQVSTVKVSAYLPAEIKLLERVEVSGLMVNRFNGKTVFDLDVVVASC
tara:strand:+ start:53 stop:199 length:147 start_codon:yes stop_codon:yes gene_type:complete